jgi:universal stress protein A
MIDLRRILVPTDFSKHSQNALNYAAAFAEKFAAHLYLLHIVQDLSLYVPEAVAGVPPLPATAEFSAAVRDSLNKVIHENKLERFSTHAEVREGSPFYEIIRYARETDADLIIMGTHGRSGLAHVLLGSVAEKVVRKAPCPVLTVRDPEHEFVHP